MNNLQETFNRLYEQRNAKKQPKLTIRGAVIMTQKEVAAMNKKNPQIIYAS